MRGLARREALGSDVALLAGCLLIALIAFALPRNWAGALVSTLRRSALRPAVVLQTRASEDRTSRFRLAEIQASRDSFALALLADTALRRENADLRGLIGMRERVMPPFVMAELLHRPIPTDPRIMMIGAGSDDGVKQFDPVVTVEGLLGQVWSTGPKSAAVLTWTHPEFRASATVGDGHVLGMLAPITVGKGAVPLLELRGVALRDSLPNGALVFTSGLGGVYPRTIPVGRVVGVTDDPLGYEQLYRVAPFANPGRATHVMVLISPRDSFFVRTPGDSTQ
jgi:cell shape-determining protein MreC